MTNASAQAINAQVVKLYSPDNEIVYFGVIGAVALVIGAALYFMTPVIQRHMKGVR